jgi:hypothetical protein
MERGRWTIVRRFSLIPCPFSRCGRRETCLSWIEIAGAWRTSPPGPLFTFDGEGEMVDLPAFLPHPLPLLPMRERGDVLEFDWDRWRVAR